MNHLILFFACFISIEIFFRFNFLQSITLIIIIAKKVFYILPNQKISDHWKELVIPSYAFSMIKYSLTILLILLCIISLFLITDIFLNGFINFSLSLKGIIESIIFASIYVWLRRLIIK